MIRKCIYWATETELWPKLWPTRPTQFWYLYPSLGVATVEYEEKWIKEFLPREEMKDDPKYGWEAKLKAGQIHKIMFNSGVTVYFRSYEQDNKNVQTASVYAIFADEECPEDLYDELNMRRSAASVKGYYHNVFTATLGQEYLYQTIECIGKEGELFPEAHKQIVSMYDCLNYMDGSKGPYTKDYIEEVKANCKDKNEIKRRVYGRFVVSKDRKYPGFNRFRNVKKSHPLPKSWLIASGVDIGSGMGSHPSAIVFLGIKPDFTEGRIFLGKKFDKEATTAGDIYDNYLKMKGDMHVIWEYYDWASKDFKLIQERRGGSFLPAEKDQKFGEQLINTLFKSEMLCIYDDIELKPLVREYEMLKSNTPKSVAKDDFSDAVRFAVAKIPWQFDGLSAIKVEKDPILRLGKRERFYKEGYQNHNDGLDLLEAEISEANDFYDW